MFLSTRNARHLYERCNFERTGQIANFAFFPIEQVYWIDVDKLKLKRPPVYMSLFLLKICKVKPSHGLARTSDFRSLDVFCYFPLHVFVSFVSIDSLQRLSKVHYLPKERMVSTKECPSAILCRIEGNQLLFFLNERYAFVKQISFSVKKLHLVF